jgi:hypothetical protein
LKIGRILHLKFEIPSLKLDGAALWPVQSAISDFEFEVQDSSNFKSIREAERQTPLRIEVEFFGFFRHPITLQVT